MKNVTKLLAAMSLALIAGCPADDDGDTAGGTLGTAGDDGATVSMDDGATVADDDGATVVMTAGDDDGATMMPDDGGSADTTAGDDGGGAMVCSFTCAADEDCLVGGTDIGFLCVDGNCSAPEPDPCDSDESCVPVLSGWGAVPCTMGGGECEATMQVCVDIGDGTGGCALAPSEFVMCETFMQEEVMATNLDDGSEVTVCGNTSGVCHAEGFCYVPCTSDDECLMGLLTCGEDGLCGCTDDAQCAAIPEAGLDTCQDGGCIGTCASDADCMSPFDGMGVACGPQ